MFFIGSTLARLRRRGSSVLDLLHLRRIWFPVSLALSNLLCLLRSCTAVWAASSFASDLVCLHLPLSMGRELCSRQIWFAFFFRLAPGSVRSRDSLVCFLDADFSWMMVFEALVAV